MVLFIFSRIRSNAVIFMQMEFEKIAYKMRSIFMVILIDISNGK